MCQMRVHWQCIIYDSMVESVTIYNVAVMIITYIEHHSAHEKELERKKERN